MASDRVLERRVRRKTGCTGSQGFWVNVENVCTVCLSRAGERERERERDCKVEKERMSSVSTHCAMDVYRGAVEWNRE